MYIYIYVCVCVCISKLNMIGSDGGLPAPSHYLNQCWNIVHLDPWGQILMKSESILFIRNKNAFQNDSKLVAILSWPQCVKHIQNDEILSMTVQTLSYLCIPLNSCLYYQWHNLIYLKFYLYIFLFPHPPTNTCYNKREYYCVMWIEYEWRDI